jgi:hypothetical protein
VTNGVGGVYPERNGMQVWRKISITVIGRGVSQILNERNRCDQHLSSSGAKVPRSECVVPWIFDVLLGSALETELQHSGGGVIGNRPRDHYVVFGVHWD